MSELIVPPNLREADESGMERYLKTGHGPVLNNRIEITAMRADGSEFPVELAIVPVRVDDEEMFVGWVRDLTNRHRAEEALQRSETQLREAHKMEAVGKLAGGITHDVCPTTRHRESTRWAVTTEFTRASSSTD